METLESRLVGSLAELLAYARRKVGDPDLAADVVQESLLKALQAAEALRDQERLFAWFYRILDNTIRDLYRRRKTKVKHMDPLTEDMEPAVMEEEKQAVCQCLYALLPTLNPDYALLIETLELDDLPPQEMAERLGITRNNLKVRRHRARQQLRRRLEETCRVCAVHGCLDCSCQAG